MGERELFILDQTDKMLHIKYVDALKMIAELEINVIPGGVLFLFIEGRTIKWKAASKTFDLSIFSVGSDLKETSIAVRAMNERRILSEKVPRTVYGMRLNTVAIPLVDDEGTTIGAFSIVLPRLHPIASSFSNFAPIIVELFPEGAFLYMSDLTKIAYVQSSRKFTLPGMAVGYELKETDIAYKTIHSGSVQIVELGPERYGVPVYIANYPLYDEENATVIVATLGVVIPKAHAANLKDMSGNLSNNLAGISTAIEHLAKSAATINENEQDLYKYVQYVTTAIDKINTITEFISSVSNQSNMLGLNAAIEAARAGEMGRGFAVVAEEIRKLATQSGETVSQIKELTQDIKKNVGEVDKRSSTSLTTSQEQAAATQEISASIEELIHITERVNTLAQEL